MKYGPVPVREAEGAILAHALRPDEGSPIRKGTMLSADMIERLVRAGIESVLVARLEAGDVVEDDAASQLADSLAGHNIHAESATTGRVNLYADANGLFVVDRQRVDALNRIDPGITLATLEHLCSVAANRMVATVKIIPYSVKKTSLAAALAICEGSLIGVDPYRANRVGVVATRLPHLKESVMDKTLRVLEGRLSPSGSTISREIRTSHNQTEIAGAIEQLIAENDMILVFGASAICDIDDVIPAAIRDLGGRIEHFGMPVDPGNLLLLGEVNGKPVLGAPGCARSPVENGFDWVLQRLLAGRKVSPAEITGMGVGGLLMEIGTRPRPREAGQKVTGKTSAIILAAGQSRRMGGTNKLTAMLGGKALVRHVAEAALASLAAEVLVVTGHDAGTVRSALAGLDVRIVENPAYMEGLSSSLAAGIGAIGRQSDRAIILLADMPGITSVIIDRMIETSIAAPGSIVLATHNGKRGNPVLWPADFFRQLSQISGDVGARHLIGENSGRVVQVETGEAAGFDIDTRDALDFAARKFRKDREGS